MSKLSMVGFISIKVTKSNMSGFYLIYLFQCGMWIACAADGLINHTVCSLFMLTTME